MNLDKPWYLSRTIWASLVAVASGIAQVFGKDVDGSVQAHLVDTILQTLTVAASMVAVFGRLTATTKIA